MSIAAREAQMRHCDVSAIDRFKKAGKACRACRIGKPYRGG
jgi:hypothetical protein